MRYFNYLCALIWFFQFCFGFSQTTTDSISIKLKEFHSSKITKVAVPKDESYFLSSDISGKILMYNTKDYSYKKALRLSNGIPITNMRLVRHDSLLLATQKFDFSDGTTDSLIGIRIHDNKAVLKRKFIGEFVSNQENALIIKSKNQYVHILEVFDDSMKKITSAYANNDVTTAAVSNDFVKVAYVEKESFSKSILTVINTKTAKEEINLLIPEGHTILHLFFDAVTKELFSIHDDKKNKKLHIYNITKEKSFNNPAFSTESVFGKFVNINKSLKEGILRISICSSSNIPAYPLIIKKDEDIFNLIVPPHKNGVVDALYLNSKGEFVFFEPYNNSFSSLNVFNVYDDKSNTLKDSYPNISRKFYKGTFLPDDNWMVIGDELHQGGLANYEHQLKYYESGTFNNRFATLDFKNYLEVQHNVVEFMTSTFNFDKRTGIHPFIGYKKTGTYENEYGFYAYNLIKDKVYKIAEDQTDYKAIVDYNATHGYLLLSPILYNNAGFYDPQEFVLVKDNKLKILKGKYKFGKLSGNGKYLLTINAKNLAEIRETSTNKVVFQTPLKDGRYNMFNTDDNGFIISTSFFEIDINTCNTESIIIDLDKATNTFKNQKVNCANIIDVTSVGSKVASIAENIGIILNDYILKFNRDEFPEAVSFNMDGSKLMISFNNGRISIYDTISLKEIAVMIHPDKDKHVFLNKDGYFFSNINPEAYLVAYNSNRPVKLNSVESSYFNPEKVLSVFGKPDEEYVNTLKKAIRIKSEVNYTEEEQQPSLSSNIEMGPPNLYVLSIGVSDYEQSDYDLTFADKDALDIAKIYGSLDSISLANYKTKFYGKNYKLLNSNNESKLNLNKYSELYASIGDLHALNTDGTMWLENRFGEFYIWDFIIGTIHSIKMPANFSMDAYTFDKVLFINPDNVGFYVKTKSSDYFSYSFSSKKFKKILQPFETMTSEWHSPLTDNRWIKFEVKQRDTIQEAHFSIGKIDSDNLLTSVSFNTESFYDISENREKILINEHVYGIRARAISSNGKHFIYSGSIGVDNDIFYKDLFNENSLPLKLEIEESIDYGTEIYVSEDGLTFSLLKTNSDDYKYKVITYNLDGNVISTIVLNNEESTNISGFTCFNNKPIWIKETPPLVNTNLYDNSNNLLEKSKPYSFEQSFVKHLTNEEANSENIKNNLIDFLNNVKSNDEVIVFFAGHGVLDKELTYYFAPHDMNFNKVKEKGVSLNAIIESLKQCQSNNILLLMDSCHSGNTLDMDASDRAVVSANSDPNKRGSKSRSKKQTSKFKVSDVVSDLFEDFLSTSGITIISASSGEDVAYENKDLGNGAFTSAFIKLLKKQFTDLDILLTADNLNKSIILNQSMIEDILKEVMILTKGRQVPDLREINKNSTIKIW